jgi:hypothetical protein
MGTLDLNEDEIRGIASDMGVSLSEDELDNVTGGLADLAAQNLKLPSKEKIAAIIAQLIMKGVDKATIMRLIQEGVDLEKLDISKLIK